MVDIPHPIRTAKSSTIGPDQYCGGGPHGNLGCRMFFFICTNFFFLGPKFFFWTIFFFIEQNFFYWTKFFSFSARHTSQKPRSHHSIIPWWIYRIPSELRSQAPLGPISTAVGDHAGISGVECFYWTKFFRFLLGIHHKNLGPIIRSYHGGYTVSRPNCEVKHHWARSVLRWGTTRESRVSNVFFFVKKPGHEGQ